MSRLKTFYRDAQQAFRALRSGGTAALPFRAGKRISGHPVHQAAGGIREYPELYQKEFLSLLRHYSVWEPYISKVISDSVSLAITDYIVELPDKTANRTAKRAHNIIRAFEENYDIRGLQKNVGFTAMYSGGSPVEIVMSGSPFPNKIHEVVVLEPEDMSFKYSFKESKYLPYHIPKNGESAGEEIMMDSDTFVYPSLLKIGENPFPVPPLLSSLEPLKNNKEIMKHYKHIISKIGALGFLNVLVKQPPKRAGESEEEFTERAIKYLEKYIIPQVNNTFSEGVSVGFEGHQTVNFEASNINFSGGEKAFDAINKVLYNGLKTAAPFMSDNMTTTETFTRVLLRIMLGLVKDVQEVIAQVLERTFILLLKGNGIKIEFLKVNFEEPLVGDILKMEQAETTKINNVMAKLRAGIINMQQAANELGYEEPAEAELKEAAPTPSAEGGQPEVTESDTDEPQSTSAENEKYLAYMERQLTGVAKDYFDEMEEAYTDSFEGFADKVSASFEDTELTDDSLIAAVSVLYIEVTNTFRDNIREISETHIRPEFTEYRNSVDAKELGHIRRKFNDEEWEAFDFRLLDFLMYSDEFYVGKHIDATLADTLANWIRDWYFAHESEVGDSSYFDDFFTAFDAEVGGITRDKLRLIVDTTMTTTRNLANIRYMYTNDIKKFERVEVGDKRTCQYCNAAHGKVFEVAVEVKRMELMVDSGYEAMSVTSPFVTTIPIQDFKTMSSAELQASANMAGAYHPRCRGRNVAVI